MNICKWINDNTESLAGKVVAITGSTGGLGSVLCRYLARLDASILALDRNLQKSLTLKNTLTEEFPSLRFETVKLDLNSIQNVSEVCKQLQGRQIDYLILNSGIYNVSLNKGDTGYNNVFQVNFLLQYCLVKGLMPTLCNCRAKVVAIGSVAHNYGKLNENDVDFSLAKKASAVYGNSKRFLMFSLYELFENERNVTLAVAHPGVTLTNMTNHYPKAINWLVKIGVKVLFPSPKRAALSVLYALFAESGYFKWIGPSLFNIWGKPKVSGLKTCSPYESKRIFEIAEEISSNFLMPSGII